MNDHHDAPGRGPVPDSARPFITALGIDEPVQGRAGGIWWRASGHGDPLLLIQGVGYPAAMWHRLVPLLEPHARMIVFDHRGIANSSGLNGLANLTIGGMATDALRVIEDAVNGPVDVFGVSLGGIVAQELALAYPKHVRRLILGCTHTADSQVVVADDEVIAMMQQRTALDDEAALRSSVPYVYAPHTPNELIEEDLDVRRATHIGWDGFKAQMRASVRFPGTSTRLHRIHHPTLVLHGELDRLVPAGNGTVIADRIPDAELRLLPGVSHNFYSEAPLMTALEISDFLSTAVEEPLPIDAEATPEELALPASDSITSGAVPGIQSPDAMPFPTSAIRLPTAADRSAS